MNAEAPAAEFLKLFAPDAPRHVAIVGSRGYPRMDLVRKRVLALKDHFPGLVVVSGTMPGGRDRKIGGRMVRPAPGVDETAIKEADDLGVPSLVLEPDWQDGKSAGPARNRQIVKHSDDLVAFWDLRSRGTAHTILMAAEAGILRAVYGPRGERIEPDDAVTLAMSALDS